jgi:nucleoside-diphosphate-sugar epimerase
MIQPVTRLLVVGGTGFIGRHLVCRALELGWSVTSLSLLLRPERQDSPDAHYVSADISSSIAIKEALGDASFQYVVNCGGYIDHTLFFKGGRQILNTHFMGVLNLVEALDRNVLRSFVNLGSSDEYGNGPAPQIETQREMPNSPYAMGKVAATHFLQALHRTEQFPATTLRPFLTYGPGQDDSRFLPQIIKGCLEGSSFPTSEGRQLRDFCFIQDTVDAVFAAFKSEQCRGEVLNIGSGRAVSIRQMIETVRNLIGKGTPRFGEIAYRPGENMGLFADIGKVKSIIGWEPKVSLEQGLEETIRWIEGQR